MNEIKRVILKIIIEIEGDIAAIEGVFKLNHYPSIRKLTFGSLLEFIIVRYRWIALVFFATQWKRDMESMSSNGDAEK